MMLCAPTAAIDITPRLNGEVLFLVEVIEVAELAQSRVYGTNASSSTLILAELFHSRA